MVPRSCKLNSHLHKINNSLAFSPSHCGLFQTPELSSVCWRGWGRREQIKNGLMYLRGSQHLKRGCAVNKCTCSIPEMNEQGLSSINGSRMLPTHVPGSTSLPWSIPVLQRAGNEHLRVLQGEFWGQHPQCHEQGAPAGSHISNGAHFPASTAGAF